MRENISITTSDNFRIAGHWYPIENPKGWALLLHMMPAAKESFAALAERLQGQGIASLAIDFRGHGESQGGPKGYEQFSDAEQQAKIKDVEAAYLWLGKQVRSAGNSYDTLNPRLVVVGASIGANLALQLLRDNPTIAGVILLSPGLDYRGVNTGTIAREIMARQAQSPASANTKILLAAGGSDDEYSTRSVRQLGALLGPRAVIKIFVRAGHGTTIFENEPAFLNEAAEWIVNKLGE